MMSSTTMLGAPPAILLLAATALLPTSACCFQTTTSPLCSSFHQPNIEPYWHRRRTGRRPGPISCPDAAALARHRHCHTSPSPSPLCMLKGLESTVDDDIRREVQESKLSSFELFQRELETNGGSIPAAIATVRRRRKDKSGDYENKYKILSDYRSYANRELLDTDHVGMAPTLDDLNQIQPDRRKVVWVTVPYRLAVFVGSFVAFPYLCGILRSLVDVTADEFDIINNQFTPGIGILYGTFVALTLDILYERQGKVQENASVEASLLSQVTQNALSLFRDDVEVAREATQIIADQVRIIVYRSRGSEMLSIMRADPYARLLSIVDRYQRGKDGGSFTPHEEALIDGLRSEIPALMEARAKRLSDEASALPPTHYLVLTVLTVLSLIGFTAATLTISDMNGKPPLESRMVFAGLAAVYVLFFNFCRDMNDPFDGVYQIKRSSAASYLLQIKWLIANQPFGADIRFDTGGLAPTYDGNVEEEEEDEFGNVAIDTEAWKNDAVAAPTTLLPPKESNGTDSLKPRKPSGDVATPVASVANDLIPIPKKDVEPQQRKAVAASIETPAHEATDTAQITKAGTVEGNAEKVLSVANFIPQRPEESTRAAGGRGEENEATQNEMASQFESLSGFSGEKTEGGGVTVPAANKTPGPAVDKEKISMYFRKTGGFGG